MRKLNPIDEASKCIRRGDNAGAILWVEQLRSDAPRLPLAVDMRVERLERRATPVKALIWGCAVGCVELVGSWLWGAL